MNVSEDIAKALSFHKKGKLAEAQLIYEAILEKFPNNFDCLHLLGVLLSDNKRVEEAIHLIKKAITINNNMPAAYSNLGDALVKAGRVGEAIESYGVAIKKRPEDPKFLNNIANAYLISGVFSEAIKNYEMAIKFKPDFYAAWNNRGRALGLLGRNDDAIKSFCSAIKINPLSPDAFINKGVIEKNSGRYSEAAASFQQAILLAPHLASAHTNYGSCLLLLGKIEASIVAFENAIRQDRLHYSAHVNLAVAYKAGGDIKRARMSLNKALTLKSHPTEAVCTLLDFCIEFDDHEEYNNLISRYAKTIWSDSDSVFDRLYLDALFKTKTSLSPIRRRNRFRFLIELLNKAYQFNGFVAECGCFKGLSSLLICQTIRERNLGSWRGGGFEIYDSFEGLSKLQIQDVGIDNESFSEESPSAYIKRAGNFSASLDHVKNSLSDYPEITYFQGWIPYSFPSNNQKKYKFVHVDVDLYEPTLSALKYFYPKLVSGGIIVCDDFNWPGAKKAVMEFSDVFEAPYTVSQFNQAVFTKKYC